MCMYVYNLKNLEEEYPLLFAVDFELHQPLNTCKGICNFGALELLLCIIVRYLLIPPLMLIGAPFYI